MRATSTDGSAAREQVVTASGDAPAAPEQGSTASRVLRPLWAGIGVSSVISVVTGLADSLAIAGLATYLASGIVGGSTDVLGVDWLSIPWVIAVLAAGTFTLNIANVALRERLTGRWDVDRRRELVDVFEAADYPVQAGQSGAGLTVTLEQTGKASGVIGDMISIINGSARTIIMIVVAFASAWQISLFTVVAGGLLVLGMRQMSKQTRKMTRALARQSADIGEYVGDVVGSSRELHLLNRWGAVDAWIDQRLDRVYHLQLRAKVMAGLVGPVFALGTILVGLLVGLAASRVGSLSSPALAASGILLIRALGAAQATQMAYQSFHDSLPYTERVLRVIEGLRAEARPAAVAPIPTGDLTIAAEAITSSYGQDTVLSGLSLAVEGPGGIAVVGPSGSGKSTLLLALSGLVPPDDGRVLLRGVDLRTLDRHEVGGVVGYLAQDPRLLRDDLRSNLTRPDVDTGDDDLRQALQRVGLTATVDAFASGLDTPLGRGGEGFSGGELQRLGLARLMVNRPSVWLLDEPTSALDRVNTDRVTEIVTEAMDHHLVVVVTHRSELLEHCKELVYVEDGAVVDHGPPALLAQRHPFVAAMVAGAEVGG